MKSPIELFLDGMDPQELQKMGQEIAVIAQEFTSALKEAFDE